MDAAVWVNVGVALGTAWLGYQTYRLAKQTSRSVDASEHLAKEATWARIDSRSPRVIVITGEPDWPPYGDRPWYNNTQRVESGTKFTLPGQGGRHLWFRTEMLLRNEGSITGIVSLKKQDPEYSVGFVEGVGSFGGIKNYEIPQAIGQDRYVLEPGQTALVVMDTCKSVEDFSNAYENQSEAPETSKMRMLIVVTDHLEDGVIDNTEVFVQAYPLEPVPGDSGGWVVARPPTSQTAASAGLASAIVMPTKRQWKES